MPDKHQSTGGRATTIAIDGPAASGKSAVGARVADELGYRFVDTGAMYRAITWAALRRSIDVNDAHALAAFAEGLRIDVHPDGDDTHVSRRRRGCDGAPPRRRRWKRMCRLSSRVPASAPTLVRIQRELARPRAHRHGRPRHRIASCCRTPLKVYLDASREVRAARRAAQMRATGEHPDLGAMLA